jgi:hypothetical protein
MINRQESNFEHFGIILLFALSFFLLAAFYQNSDKQEGTGAVHSQITAFPAFAMLPKVNPQPLLPQSLAIESIKLKFRYTGEQPGLESFNRLMDHRIIFLTKVELLIKPVILQELYNHHLHLYSEDLPVLS